MLEWIIAIATIVGALVVAVSWWPRRKHYRFAWPLIVAVLLFLLGLFMIPEGATVVMP